MKPFAKLFGEDALQILVEIGRHPEDDNPSVRIAFQVESIGTSELRFNYDDDDAGWDKAEALFDKLDETKARRIVNTQLKNFEKI